MKKIASLTILFIAYIIGHNVFAQTTDDVITVNGSPEITVNDTNLQIEPGVGQSFAIYGKNGSDGVLNIWGGYGIDSGSGITFYGENYNASGFKDYDGNGNYYNVFANDIKIRSGDDRKLHYISVANQWDFRDTSLTNINNLSVEGAVKIKNEADHNNSNLYSGQYTPNISNVRNVLSSAPHEGQYIRVGDVVTVSGRVQITPASSNTNTFIDISLPIASTFSVGANCSGTATEYVRGTTQPVSAAIYGNGTDHKARLRYVSKSTAEASFYYTFTYSVN